MKRLINLAFILFSLTAFAIPGNPDFSHPQTTLKNAIMDYENALRNPDGSNESIITSLLEITGATAAIDLDSIVRVIPRVDSAIAVFPDGATGALLVAVKAELISTIYRQNYWTYNQVQTPDDPTPADITEWNGNQFRREISKLAEQAFDMAAASKAAPLTDYKNSIAADKLTLRFFPNVVDFIATKSVSLLISCDEKGRTLPIIEKCVKASRPQSASWFYWSTSLIEGNKASSSDMEDVTYNDTASGEKPDALARLYLDNKDCEESGYALQRATDYYWSYDYTPSWVVPALRDHISRFPDAWNANILRNKLARLTRPQVSAALPPIAAPSRPFEVTLTHRFTRSCGIRLYKLTSDAYANRNFRPRSHKAVKTITIKTDKEIAKSDTTIPLTIDSPGYYAIAPEINDSIGTFDISYMVCSTYLPTLVSGTETETFAIMDFVTGAPVKGVSVSETVNKTVRKLGNSDINGMLTFSPAKATEKNRWSQVNYTFTDSRGSLQFPGMSDYIHQTSDDSPEYHVQIFVDRPIYHPGDTIKWAAILTYGEVPGKAKVAERVTVNIEFDNVNSETIDTLTATTDAMGRIHGMFKAPTDGLTGDYGISIATIDPDGDSDEYIGTNSVTVSDFKLPTFKIDSLSVERDHPAKGKVTLKGRATTYAGMAVVNAKVEAEIWGAVRWRWFSPSSRLGLVESSTDANGDFEVIVDDSLTIDSRFDCFIADLTVTSTAGEAATATKSFTTGKPYTIVFNSDVALFDTDKPLTEPFKVYDADGEKVDIELVWKLTPYEANNESTVIASKATGKCRSNTTAKIDISDVPSGIYSLSVAPVDESLADKRDDIAKLRLYSIGKNTMPDDQPILIPKSTYTTDNEGCAEITIGTPYADTYIYKVFCSGDQTLSVDVELYNAGFHKVDVEIPDGETKATLIVFTTRDGETTQESVSIRRPDRRVITLEGSSIRDRLTPGSPETWTLTLRDVDGNGIPGAMIATMFNSSLSSLQHLSWPFALYLQVYEPTPWLKLTNNGISTSTIYASLKSLNTTGLNVPSFNPAIDFTSIRKFKFNIPLQLSRASAGVKVSEEKALYGAYNLAAAEEETAVVTAYGATKKAETTGSLQEVVTVATDTYADEGGQETQRQQQFDYRDSEILQALWMPNLVIGDDGNVQLAFTVPNANTTWAFRSFAWTDDLRSSLMIKDLVANKPVMVQPNLPRFLRAGDRANILATVYNNSDSTATVTTVIELFDIASGLVTATASSTDTIVAGASATAGIMVDAPDDASMIGYRVRSTLGLFTDGEQAFIAIEPATSAVIESEAFYLNPGESDYSIDIPKGKGMQSTLDYTDNPAWNIIKELPGLATYDALTSTSAARLLFGAATACGLMKEYPALAAVLKAWTDNPDSEALVSRLSQNDELKAAVLAETPWVQAAATDSHRMARLSLLFDQQETDRNINASISTLQKLQRADGGWSWGSWSDKSSTWATNMILQDLGRLKSIGYLPQGKGLDKMVARGIAYYESILDKNVKTDRALAYIASLFPECKLGVRGTTMVNATLQAIIKDWASGSTWDKAIDALILNASGYPAMAKEIIGSLREFGVRSDRQGISFPSITNVNDYADLLYAFAKIDPSAKEIDGMRQWLVIRQQTTTDLMSMDPTRVIAAFTTCGSNWLTDNGQTSQISIGGQPLDIDKPEIGTGHIVMSLPNDAAGKTMDITRGDASVPAYGAVISRFTAKSTDVKAVSSDDLSIEKRLTVLRDGKWQYADEIRLGEQVRVLLTIKAKRDLEYVTVIDERPSALEPVDQLPGWAWSGGAGFYRENRNSSTRLYINYLPKGTYQVTVDMTAGIAGRFTSGIATVQSQLSPSTTAHSAGSTIVCK